MDFNKRGGDLDTVRVKADPEVNDGDSVQDAYTCKHIFAMEPGRLKYDSGWHNWRGRPELDWSYTQPAVETLDQSSPSGNVARWVEKFNTSSAQDNTNGMKSGSTAWVNDQSYGSGEVNLLYLVAEGEFRDTSWCCADYHTLTHTWRLWVDY